MAETLKIHQALNRALDEAMAEDDSVFILGEDVGLYGGSYRVTEGLYAKYGDWRVRDTPISEGSFTGLGVGAALAGMRPVVEIMTVNFALLALDAIINMAAKVPFMSGGQFPMPLVIRMPGGVARQLAAQHSQRLEHCLMNVPGLRTVTPATPQDSYWQLKQAILSDDPIVVLEHELLYFEEGPLDPSLAAPPMHRAHRVREGDSISLITYSRMRLLAEQAAETLAGQGIDAEIIDLRSLSPIDWQTCIDSVRKTHHALIIEEDCGYAGAGAEIAAQLSQRCFYDLDAPIQRVAGLDMPTPYNGELESRSIPRSEDIVAAATRLLEED